MIKAIADLHLALSVPDKDMSVFGSSWKDYMLRISKNWKERVAETDTVLVAGDISWAMRIEEMGMDWNFLANLPGRKVLIKGNHDYWASCSVSKVRRFLPSNCYFLGKDYYFCEKEQAAVAGTRLWSSSSIKLSSSFFQEPVGEAYEKSSVDEEKIFQREKNRLGYVLQNMPKEIENKIVMTHFPPIGMDYKENEITNLLEQYKVKHCIFGHLHGVTTSFPRNFVVNDVHYHLVSSDCIDFSPITIC